MLLDTRDSESPSLVVGGNSELREPDDTASTLHNVGVLCGYDNNDVYIPTLTKVLISLTRTTYSHVMMMMS